jgi:hypothetical protein
MHIVAATQTLQCVHCTVCECLCKVDIFIYKAKRSTVDEKNTTGLKKRVCEPKYITAVSIKTAVVPKIVSKKSTLLLPYFLLAYIYISVYIC